MQFDRGDGPKVTGPGGILRSTLLFCAWLAWPRYRVVIPVWDQTLPTLIGCLDATVRRFGGVPTYALTDNPRTVRIDHVAGIAVRHLQIDPAHYRRSSAGSGRGSESAGPQGPLRGRRLVS